MGEANFVRVVVCVYTIHPQIGFKKRYINEVFLIKYNFVDVHTHNTMVYTWLTTSKIKKSNSLLPPPALYLFAFFDVLLLATSTHQFPVVCRLILEC